MLREPLNFIKKNIGKIAEVILLIFVYFSSMVPLRDFDIWFHLKSGELFVNQGHLQFTEVFSYAAQGRQWIPYEWLFQIIVYLISKVGLFWIPPFIAIFSTLMIFFFMRILDYIFGLKLFPRLLLGSFFFVSVYEFITARPHVLAYSFVCLTLFLILARIFRGRKWIFLSPVIVLIWTNLHSTAFIAWGLCLAYAMIALFQYLLKKEKNNLAVAKDLFFVSGINFVITILPPLGFLSYQLLWDFFRDEKFLATFISEWGEVTFGNNPGSFIFLTAFLAISVLFCGFVVIKTKKYLENMWLLPLFLMGIVAYTATRNLVMGQMAIFIILGWSLNYLIKSSGKKMLYFLWIPLILFGIFYFGISYYLKRDYALNHRYYYPVKTAEFAKRYLKGRMFNDYTYGGYVMYTVYPTLNIFIDGRADVYHMVEMREYMKLSLHKYDSDTDYRKFLNTFWNEYNIDFAVLPAPKNQVMRRIAKMLNTDPNWALVFWDDSSQVFVRRDGRNDDIIKQLEAKYATPYLKDPFVAGKADEAFKEYEKMENIAKSAKNENAIGYILLGKKDYNNARSMFLEAIAADPTFESPYMNLGELEAKDGRLENAIALYQTAKSYADDRGLIYIRLGTLMLQNGSGPTEVKKVWQEGVQKTGDDDTKAQLQKLLGTL
jgi:tetratricopeptide (TPR) repeat protein